MELHKLEESKIRKLNKLFKSGAITELQFKTASNFVREYYNSKAHKLKENKTSQLKKLLNAGNITEDQFNTADKFFKDHNSFEKEIDWNRGLKITWEDLEKVISKERNTKSQAKKKIRKGLEGFKEGKDYLVLEETDSYIAYQPFTWEASRMIASHYVEPSRNEKGEISDASWCTSYQKDRSYWDNHNEIEAFIYICGETVPSKKVAISISENNEDASGSEFRHSLNNLNFNIWNFKDHNDTIEEDKLLKIIPNLCDFIEKAYDNWKNKKKIAILSKLYLNPNTNRYDYDGSLSNKELRYFVAKNGNGFTINFGTVTRRFNCSNLSLISLKGAPQEVGGTFNCSNNHLISLKGSPQIVGESFRCYSNQLTSLEEAPRTVGYVFNCSDNQLTSLEGAPQTVGGYFDCRDNYNLHSLDGIGKVEGEIYKDF